MIFGGRSKARKFADFMRFFDIDYTAPEAPTLSGVATEDSVTTTVETAKTEVVTQVKETAEVATDSRDLVLSKTTFVSTSGVTLTLPATPSQGDKVGIIVGNVVDTIVARNGSYIMGLDEDLTIDTANAGFELVYTDAANGWRII